MVRNSMSGTVEQPISLISSPSSTGNGSPDLGDEDFQSNRSYSRQNQQESSHSTRMNDYPQSQLEEQKGAAPMPMSQKNDVIKADCADDAGGSLAENMQVLIEIDFRNYVTRFRDILQEKDREVTQLRKAKDDIKAGYDRMVEMHDNAQEESKSLETSLCNVKKNLSQLQQTHHGLQSKHRVLVAHNDKSSQNVQALKTEVTLLRRDFEFCKDDLFRLQPADQVPDTEIIDDFEFLCQQIQNWIKVELSNYEAANPQSKIEIFIYNSKEAITAALLRKFQSVGEYWVRYEIHRHLQEYMLDDEIHLLGPEDHVLNIFRKIESSMTKLDPPRDPSTIKAWRSETLRAFTSTPEFATTKRRCIANLNTLLFSFLSQIFSVLKKQKGARLRLFDQVLQPAAKLATKIHLSASTYAFAPKLLPNPTSKFRKTITFDKAFVAAQTLIDVNTRRTLKVNSKTVVENDGVLGNVLMLVEPGLMRSRAGGAGVELRKSVYLVDLFGPLGERKRETRGRPCKQQDGAVRIKREEDSGNA